MGLFILDVWAPCMRGRGSEGPPQPKNQTHRRCQGHIAKGQTSLEYHTCGDSHLCHLMSDSRGLLPWRLLQHDPKSLRRALYTTKPIRDEEIWLNLKLWVKSHGYLVMIQTLWHKQKKKITNNKIAVIMFLVVVIHMCHGLSFITSDIICLPTSDLVDPACAAELFNTWWMDGAKHTRSKGLRGIGSMAE